MKKKFIRYEVAQPVLLYLFTVNKALECAAKTLLKYPSRISAFKVKISELKRSLKITMTIPEERGALIFPVQPVPSTGAAFCSLA